MTVLILKIVAVICMVCDHIRYVDSSLNNEVTRLLGRIAFPIFAFLLVEGYVHTKNLKKYLIRLGIFSVISEIPYLLFVRGCNISEEFELNVIFTLLLGIVSLIFYDKLKENFLNIISKNFKSIARELFQVIIMIISIVLICVIAQILNIDYGALGIAAILLFYIFRKTKYFKNIIVASVFVIELYIRCKLNKGSISYCMPYFYGYIASAIILSCYNGNLGKYKLKYLFYAFYPVHLLLLYFVNWFV